MRDYFKKRGAGFMSFKNCEHITVAIKKLIIATPEEGGREGEVINIRLLVYVGSCLP